MAGPMKAQKGVFMPKAKAKKGTFKRLVKTFLKGYPVAIITLLICIIVSAIASASTSIFLENIASAIESKNWDAFVSVINIMLCVYVLSLTASLVQGQTSAYVTQKFLKDTRVKLFDKMQTLPIKYFDTHTHGDVMSIYTNDTDALRQLISQSLPQICSTIISLSVVFFVMIYYSLWLTLVVLLGVVGMFAITKTLAGNSSKYFVKQQQSLGALEGFVEESLNGQKVIKVFNHEDETKETFDKANELHCNNATRANIFANLMGPVMNNFGHLLYVVLAIVGTILAISSAPNVSISNSPKMTLPIIIAFLPMSKMFTMSINQIAQQINMIFMGIAGADRIFELMDASSEKDDGYVTLVNAVKDENGNLVETTERSGLWAWKHPHKADGTIDYTELKGDIVLKDVDFGYTPEKLVLKNISLYAKPGQMVAFVGATGAGKTTITNLINRFYDIDDGKIRYDGININKIKKADLRRSLGVVLQETNLFTGTVMDNIRYGKLDATDEDCISAAKLANAHDFITRLPDGYKTHLAGDGANLSQGQRQLLSIARAMVADAPVMILDEATSSIDTRTELLVQKGMDRLMQGRTVFVIAHRLSTVKNADVIIVLDHGTIIERGNHDELMEQKGNYYRLYTGSFAEE